jgi:hypothetical protein
MTTTEEVQKIAQSVLDGIRYGNDKSSVQALAENMLLLESAGLTKLNKRLTDGRRKILDTITEHNFAAQLVRQHLSDRSFAIEYEPEGLKRPVDFRIQQTGITYFVQVKNLARLARENIQTRIIAKVGKLAASIKVGRYFDFSVSDDFVEDDIPALLNFMRATAENSIDGKAYAFLNTTNTKARLTFWSPHGTTLSYLTLGTAGDIGMLDVTNLAEGQIKDSFRNAAGAFEENDSDRVVNLIAVEADKVDDMHMGNALFGTEFEGWRQDQQSWSRNKDGLFDDSDFSMRVAGVIALRRKEQIPVSHYRSYLYINRVHVQHVDEIVQIFAVDKVV